MKGSFRILLVCGPCLLGGCLNTASDVLRDRESGKGTRVAYPLDIERSWEVSKTVLRWCRANVIEEHKNQVYMLTELSDQLGNNAYAGVWLQAAGSSTNVTVITRRKDPLALATPVTEEYFHRRFKQAVKLLSEGQLLTATPPSAPPD